MSDKTALGISEELHQFIEALVEEVVLDGKTFENHKRYLSRFCDSESIVFEFLEKNLTNFFTIMGEWKTFHTKSSSMMAKIIARDCYLSESFVDNLLMEATDAKGEDQEESGQQTDMNEEKETSEYQELMADLVPDLVQMKERLDVHLYFVKKIAHHSGWDGDEVASALSDFVSMYSEFQQEHSKGEAFSNSEKRLLTHQASLANIDQSVLDVIF